MDVLTQKQVQITNSFTFSTVVKAEKVKSGIILTVGSNTYNLTNKELKSYLSKRVANGWLTLDKGKIILQQEYFTGNSVTEDVTVIERLELKEMYGVQL